MKTKKRILSLLLGLALVLTLIPGMSLTAYAASSGSNGGFNWTLDDDGKMTVTGSGALPKWFIDQNGNIKSIVFDENCQVSGLAQNSIYWANNATEIIINSTADLTIAGSAIWYSSSGGDPVSVTINAPKVTIAGSTPFFAYGRQLNITVNTNELIVYNGTMSYLGQYNSNNSFAYPANSTVYIPAGYVFTESHMQERYDEMVQRDMEEMFWQDYGRMLTEGRDYTYNAEASSVALTSENAGTVFGGAQTSSSNAYTAPHNHSFTYKANGATITATCGGTGICDITGGLTLTISAPTGNLVYDGTTTYPAALSTGYNTTAFPDTYSISYTKDGSAYSGVPKDAGTYTASVTAGTGDAAKTASVSYTIAKAAATVTKAPTAKTLTYNGQKQELVNAGSTEDGTMYYAVTTENKAPTDENLYATDIPTETNAGTYYVWYKVFGDENHSDSEAKPVEVIIKEKESGDEEETDIPRLQKISRNSITIETISGFEYSIDDGNSWQASGEFNGLVSGREYVVIIRKTNGTEVDRIFARTNEEDRNTVTKEQFRKTIDDGTGIVRAETRVRDDVPVGAIDNIDMEFAKAIMSDSELEDVKGGKSCLIYLDVSGFDEDENSDIGNTVREKQPGASFGMIFDISLWKKIGDNSAKQVRTGFDKNSLEVTMSIPEDLQSENRMFYVGCQHEYDDGTKKTEFIETTTNEDGTETSFKITGCSTYSLYYTDPVKESSDSSSASTAAGYVTRQRVDATKLMNLPSGVKIKYTTSDKKLAKVSRKGVIKIQKKAGTVTITAKNKNTGATIDSCTLVIEKPVIKQKKLVVTGVTAGNLDSWKTRSANEFLGNTSISPKWYSSKPSVASVDQETGEVTIKGRGKAKIYAVFGADAVGSKFGTRKIYKYKIVSKK